MIFGFDDDEDLTYMPMAARRALDAAGKKLSLSGWQALARAEREKLIARGAEARVDVSAVRAMLPGVADIEPAPDPERPLEVVTDAEWARLSPLERYCVAKSRAKPEKLARVLRELLGR